jgi:hypothetical protein
MSNPHLAVHISRQATRRILILQPRNSLGQFLSPVRPTLAPATVHVTLNGGVIR